MELYREQQLMKFTTVFYVLVLLLCLLFVFQFLCEPDDSSETKHVFVKVVQQLQVT